MNFFKDISKSLLILISIMALMVLGAGWFFSGGFKHFGGRIFKYEDLLTKSKSSLPIDSKTAALGFVEMRWKLDELLREARDVGGQNIPTDAWTITVDFNESRVYQERLLKSWLSGNPLGSVLASMGPAPEDRRKPEAIAQVQGILSQIPDHWMVQAFVPGVENLSCAFAITKEGQPLPNLQDAICGFEN